MAIRVILFPVAGFRPIRIGSIKWKGKISILISYIEPRLREFENSSGTKPLLFVLNFGNDPNRALSNLYRTKIKLLDDNSPIFRRILAILKRIASAVDSEISIKLESGHQSEADWRAWQLEPALSFSTSDQRRGREYLKKQKIASRTRYIGFVLREERYYESLADQLSADNRLFLTPRVEEKTRDRMKASSVRNPELAVYLKALEQVVPHAWEILRFGSHTDRALPKTKRQIIDYALLDRSEFLDLYLLAHCQFLVVGGSGLWWVAAMFNRPSLLLDAVYPSCNVVGIKDLFTYQKIRCKITGRKLSIRQIYARFNYEHYGTLGHADFAYADVLEKENLELIPNSSEEISSAVNEMVDRTLYRVEHTKEDKELQREFIECFPQTDPVRIFGCKIALSYLRNNMYLVE